VNNFSIGWKLVFVAAIALMLAAVMPPLSTPALVQANIFAPASVEHRASFQVAQPNDVNQERRLSPGAIIGLICAIAASSVALGIAFGLRRKIDRIAGPDPEKADDD
jgi:ABC-type Co2+ transport system permease subunit